MKAVYASDNAALGAPTLRANLVHDDSPRTNNEGRRKSALIGTAGFEPATP